ncbi:MULTISPECIES: hypothetical protein [unclassified Moorena]|uniref:hypothetical protein n=1 Tax=unclassified Moorena TaxID=2683338 RepID=UPI0013FF1AD7|nr:MULTISPECIES: hypothetical protein [unclassified Moorena]NEO12384.1 hypothetical protein [Moorena sp. SIO3E8]NEP97541.1 hypothetical protein [Moorena sp. SIO3F7]
MMFGGWRTNQKVSFESMEHFQRQQRTADLGVGSRESGVGSREREEREEREESVGGVGGVGGVGRWGDGEMGRGNKIDYI